MFELVDNFCEEVVPARAVTWLNKLRAAVLTPDGRLAEDKGLSHNELCAPAAPSPPGLRARPRPGREAGLNSVQRRARTPYRGGPGRYSEADPDDTRRRARVVTARAAAGSGWRCTTLRPRAARSRTPTSTPLVRPRPRSPHAKR